MLDTRMPVGFVDGSNDTIIDMNNVKTLSYDLDENFKPCVGKVVLKDDTELEITNIHDVVNWIYDQEVQKRAEEIASEV